MWVENEVLHFIPSEFCHDGKIRWGEEGEKAFFYLRFASTRQFSYEKQIFIGKPCYNITEVDFSDQNV